MKQTISILLMLLAATGPLLSGGSCQADCIARKPAREASGLHGGQHSPMHAHAGYAQPTGRSVSTSTCAAHAAAVLQSREFLLPGFEKAPQVGLAMAVVESRDVLFADATFAESLHTAEPGSSFPASVMPLRI